MSDIFNLSRRSFVKTSLLAGGGLILGFRLREAAAADTTSGAVTLNAFVRIAPDNTVIVIVNHSEMGQGAYTTDPMMVADEMDADWSKVRYEPAGVDPVYNHTVYGVQLTGGSSSTWSEWARLRKVGASARQMLIAAAADTWKVDPSTCRTENGVVISSSGQRSTFGELAEKASHLTPPADPKLKDRKDFKLIGKEIKRLDSPGKTDGSAIFAIDVTLPGMLVAMVARAPVFGGKVLSFNADKAKAIPGVKHVIQIDRGIAVVATGFWPAKLGREALEITWDDGPLGSLDSVSQGQEYLQLAQKPGVAARHEGDAAGVIDKAAKKFEAVYDLPYLAHAPMEPQNCVADVRDDRCEVWLGTQFQTADNAAIVQETGLKPEQVKLHTTLLGGGFGRRATFECHTVREAVQISKAVKAPIKVIWTREDDMQGGWYRPRALHAIKGSLDDKGNPSAWHQRIVCQSFVAGSQFEKVIIKDGVDGTAVEGAKELPYNIPHIQVEWQQAPAGVPTLWLRSVGHTHTAFVVETFVDELAHAAGKDPFEYRRSLLEHEPRYKRVLEFVADKAGWKTPPVAGIGRGIAVHESFGSYVGHVVEASVSKEGLVRVHRVVAAIDCGPAVNPYNIYAQLEGAAVFGLTMALYGEITFEKGRVQQHNFYDYRMLRMHEMPKIETYYVPSEDKMGGVGEPGVPTVAPALANAIFQVTGKRLRRLPIRPEDLRA